jgi:beta-phosphoglucomutase
LAFEFDHMTQPKALLFDLNGTIVDDMNFHISAWHRILNDLGATLSLERTKQECYGKNDELLERIFPGRFSMEQKLAMSIEKEKKYQEDFRPLLKPINGITDFLEKAKQAGIPMAIGSAAIMFNIDFVLDGLDIRQYFDAIVGAEHVVESKPDPETFTLCADRLGTPYKDCIVFEDSPKGVEAAARAGMKAVVITTMHTKEEFGELNNILFFIEDYHNPQLDQLLN